MGPFSAGLAERVARPCLLQHRLTDLDGPRAEQEEPLDRRARLEQRLVRGRRERAQQTRDNVSLRLVEVAEDRAVADGGELPGLPVHRSIV